MKEIQHFYTKLFSTQNTEAKGIDWESILKNSQFRQLSDLESVKLEGELKLEELSKALYKMKNNKSPRVDGFPAEFFKVFWEKLKFFVLRTLNTIFTTGRMSVTMRTCIINSLPKGNKPREFLNNWRPISLLSVLYKLASVAIADRLKSVLPVLISKAQNGFLKGCFIGDCTRLVYDIMQYPEHNNLTGQLMLVDFQKAFDSVSWSFLNRVLKMYNFCNKFCKWINIFNTNIEAFILQPGFLSRPINIERGYRQGDPIAAYLFLICADVLYLCFQDNPAINGISINNNNYKMTQFADDTTVFLDGTKDSLVAALNTLEIFGSLSGNLTPIGKIAVIKTFVISALTHMFSAIPSPSSDVIMHLNQIFYSFIWNNKPHKISKRQITNNYIKGGLQMVNLENFIMSHKLVWIK